MPMTRTLSRTHGDYALRALPAMFAALLWLIASAAFAPGMARAQNGDGQSSADVAAGDKAFARGDFARAYDLYNVACDRGNGLGCFKAGKMEEEGKGMPKSLKAAALLYEYACTNEYLVGCVRGGFIRAGNTLAGQSLRADDYKASELYAFACERKQADACANLSSMVGNGRGVPADLVKAADLALEACEMGSATGCSMYGDALISGRGRAAEPEKARGFYRRACNRGVQFACDQLASRFNEKIPRLANPGLSGDERLSHSNYAMGLDYFNRRLYTNAYTTLRPFSDAGDPEAQYSVGWMLAAGEGTQRDYLEAARLLVGVMRKGDQRAQSVLSQIAPKVREAEYVYMIDTQGPDMSSLQNFLYEVEVYCRYGGKNCSLWKGRYYEAQRANNARAVSDQMRRAWTTQSVTKTGPGNDPRRGGETFGACIARQARARGASAGSTVLDFDCY